MAASVRVVLVDDHVMLREGLRDGLARYGIEVVGEAGTAAEAMALCQRLQPAVAIVDIRLPDADGIAASIELRQVSPETGIMILTGDASVNDLRRALEAGVRGFCLKSIDRQTLAEAVRQVWSGRVVLPTLVGGPDERLELNQRERYLLNALAQGNTNREIADGLGLSEQTIKNQLSQLYSKLQVSNRAAAVAYGLQHNLIDATPGSSDR